MLNNNNYKLIIMISYVTEGMFFFYIKSILAVSHFHYIFYFILPFVYIAIFKNIQKEHRVKSLLQNDNNINLIFKISIKIN